MCDHVLMSKEPLLPDVGRPAELYRLHRRHQLTVAIVVALSAVAAVAAVVLTLDLAWLAGNPVPVALAVVMAVAPVYSFLRQTLRGRRTPLERAEPGQLGPYGREELQALFAEVRATFAGREDPALYLHGGPDAEAQAPASTINALLLGNLLRSLNAVYLTPGLLHLLRRDELRAVLAHELAHFYGVMSVHARMIGLVALVLAAAAVAVVQGAGVTSWWAALGVGLAVRAVGFIGLGRLTGEIDHLQEHLADLEAAQRVGYAPMINALLRLELRDELMTAVLFHVVQAVEERPGLDLGKVMQEITRRLPPRTVTFSEIEPLVDEVIARSGAAATPGDGEGRRAVVVGKLRALREAYLERKGRRKIDWAAFDTVVPDGQLDEQELGGYLDALARDPEAVIAHSELELELGDERPTHPRTRRRILFLARELAGASTG